MGYSSTFTIIYQGQNAEPVLKQLLTDIEFNVESADLDFENKEAVGFDATWIDVRIRTDDLYEILTPLSNNGTFKIIFEDDYSEGPFSFYIGKDADLHDAQDAWESLNHKLGTVLSFDENILLKVAHANRDLLADILSRMALLDLTLSQEPVLKKE